MRTTIKDISQETGLSIATISLALSEKPSRVSKETKRLVREAAKRLNYRPNHLALGLATQRTKMLGIIMPDISNAYFAKIAKGACHEADSKGYNLTFCDTENNPDKDVRAVNMLLERGADGIMLICSNYGQNDRLAECIDMCNQEDVPMVLIDRIPAHAEFHAVTLNHELGGYIATSHLLEMGHTRIGCITGSTYSDSSNKRVYGYIKALQERSISFDSSLIAEGDYYTDCGYELAKPLLDQGVTAIFAFNDLIAYGVYRYLNEKNLEVPDDISLIGFDDIYLSQIIPTPLTTIRQPTYEIGRESVSKLIKTINKEPAERITTFEPEIVIRESTKQYKLDK